MAAEPSGMHAIPYTRLFPWVRLFRGFGLACDPNSLALAAFGLLLLHLGWQGLDRLFPSSRALTPDVFATARAAGVEDTGNSERDRAASIASARGLLLAPLEPPLVLTAPFRALFSPRSDGWAFLHAACAALWTIVVWGVAGGAIARIAVMKAALARRVGAAAALRYAARHWTAVIGAPLLPMVALGFYAALCAGFALLYRVPHPLGARVAGLLALLPLVASLSMALIFVGLAAGWPLMQATAAAEGEDGLDALSRSFAYVHQRPWNYLGYATLAWGIGVVGWTFVRLFADLVVMLARWSLSFGASGTSFDVYYGLRAGPADAAAAALHHFWLGLLSLAAYGWLYSYFWTATSLIYLLLRRDVDGTAWQTIDRKEETAADLGSEPYRSAQSVGPPGAERTVPAPAVGSPP